MLNFFYTICYEEGNHVVKHFFTLNLKMNIGFAKKAVLLTAVLKVEHQFDEPQRH